MMSQVSCWSVLFALAAAGSVSEGILIGGGPSSVAPVAKVGKWDQNDPTTFPIKFALDQGSLGDLTSEQAAELVRDSFAQWVDVETSSVDFEDLGFLDVDVTVCDLCGPEETDYSSFIQGQIHPENPVVFDNDGQIIEDLFGTGSRNSVLGFASVRFCQEEQSVVPCTRNSGLTHFSAWIVLNGFQSGVFAGFSKVITHEIGHLVGLDHTQINSQLAFNGQVGDDQFVAMMYPFILEQGPDQPIRDDIAWVSWLYPEESFQTETGTITGRISRRSGGFFGGANVVAAQVMQNLDDSVTESLSETVSVVSDFLMTSDGSYQLPGLTPGDYVVFIEPLNPLFVQGSSVGPYETRFIDFVKDYYNDQNESGSSNSDDPAEKLVITVQAGVVVSNVDLVSNEVPRPLNQLGDDDETIFEFAEGFTFPFFGERYTEVIVNSDGNLTFGKGDGGTADRDATRFLSGPPRVSPLFTDLDPSETGEVTSENDQKRVVFTWDAIPEWSPQGGRPANQFSVTLFANGDVLFDYAEVEVTPDDEIQAIIGISPGNLSEGSEGDLSAQAVAIQVNEVPIYEVFHGNSFDLTGQQILFQSSSNQLLFPFYQSDTENFFGYSITNLSSETAQVQVEGWQASGVLQDSATNPQLEEISVESQISRLGSEFFAVSPGVFQSGWVRMTTDTPEPIGSFAFGNGLMGAVTKMDGAVAVTEKSQVLFFTRIFEGPNSFPLFGGSADKDARTTLFICNPNSEEIVLTLELFSSTGQSMGLVVAEPVAPLGRFSTEVGSAFDVGVVSDGYVRVDVQGPGAAGFALIELEDTLLGLNASYGNETNVLESAHLSNGTLSGSGVFTSLKLVNTSSSPRMLQIRAFAEEGGLIKMVEENLGAFSTFQKSVHQIFDLGRPTGSVVTTGSIQIEADGPDVIGDVVFGEPTEGRFAAALALQSTRFRRAVFDQVANGSLEEGNPDLDLFTGIALFNPNEETAQVLVQVFDKNGNLAGQIEIVLESHQQRSELVENLIPQTADLIGGYIVVESDRNLVAQELFGNNTLQFLSAVSPQVIY